MDNAHPVNSSIDPLLHCPRCGPCMMLAGRVDAPRGSEWATSSISNTDGPPRLVLLFDNKLVGCLDCPYTLDELSPFIESALLSESDRTGKSAACVELVLSLRKRPMIDFGCFGFSIPPKGMTMKGVEWVRRRKTIDKIVSL